MIKLVCGHIPRSIFAVFPKTVQTGHMGKKFKSSNYIVFWRVLRDNDQKVHSNAHAHPYPRLLTSRCKHSRRRRPLHPKFCCPTEICAMLPRQDDDPCAEGTAQYFSNSAGWALHHWCKDSRLLDGSVREIYKFQGLVADRFGVS